MMIRSVMNALTKSIKDCFKNTAVWESPVRSGYKDGDFVISVATCSTMPKPGGFIMHTVGFKIEVQKENYTDFCDILIDLDKAVDVLELDSGVMLKGLVEEQIIKDGKLTLIVYYSFYGVEGTSQTLMEELISG